MIFGIQTYIGSSLNILFIENDLDSVQNCKININRKNASQKHILHKNFVVRLLSYDGDFKRP